VVVLSQPITTGPMTPPKFAKTLISPITPASAAPLRNSGGTVQNIGRAMPMPISTKVTAIKAQAEVA